MSEMIKCNRCGRYMYSDSRSDKGDYHHIRIDGAYTYHLCRKCYDLFMKSILHMECNEDEQQYIDMDGRSEEAEDTISEEDARKFIDSLMSINDTLRREIIMSDAIMSIGKEQNI